MVRISATAEWYVSPSCRLAVFAQEAQEIISSDEIRLRGFDHVGREFVRLPSNGCRQARSSPDSDILSMRVLPSADDVEGLTRPLHKTKTPRADCPSTKRVAPFGYTAAEVMADNAWTAATSPPRTQVTKTHQLSPRKRVLAGGDSGRSQRGYHNGIHSAPRADDGHTVRCSGPGHPHVPDAAGWRERPTARQPAELAVGQQPTCSKS